VNSPAIDYALKGLARCWLAEHDRWSHIYHLDGRSNPNESLPYSDVFYTLNVLLGMTRVTAVPSSVNLKEIYNRNVRELIALPVKTYAFGMALWAGAELGVAVPGEVIDRLDTLMADQKNWLTFRAQDAGMLLIGISAQSKLDSRKWTPVADSLFALIVKHYHWPSGLFSDGGFGFRRRYASFASEVYLAMACYAYGELSGNQQALKIANDCSRKLIELQGPNGEWPWFFDAKKGSVVDFYEVYSVHQYGMAPALLEFAERHDVAGVREAVTKGFDWIFGTNQLGVSMLVPNLNLSIRSQVRKGELNTSVTRGLRALRNSAFGHGNMMAAPSQLELRMECRSYELGWLLWSFGRRTDYRELTHHRNFTSASSPVNRESTRVDA
jgi:hypothetical protein